MSIEPDDRVLEATRQAIRRIRSYGIEGPRPIEEIEALLEHDETVSPALNAALQTLSGEDLSAAIHLVVLLRRCDVLETVRRVAFEQPADLTAKREAIAALRACDETPDPETQERVDALSGFAAGPAPGALDELLGWPVAWRRPALDEWLHGAGPDHLGEVEAAIGRDDELDAELLDWLGDQATAEAAEALQRFLRDAGDRRQIKRAKRALHRMRSRGIAVEDPTAAPQGEFSMALEAASLDDARAFVTSIDGRGARLVWVLWRSPGGGSRLLQAVVDDRHGLREAELATVTRTGFREYVERMRANNTVLVEQVDAGRAVEVLQDASRRNQSLGNEVPEAYRQWAEVVGVAELVGAKGEPSAAGERSATDSRADPPPVAPGGEAAVPSGEAARIYEQLDTLELSGDESLIEASMTLLREPHFQSWAMEGPVIEAAADEIMQAETSTLMISDEQRRERMEAAIRDAVRDGFDDETRRRYRGRLEVMAMMLWERGEREPARQALAAAIGLTEIDDLFHQHAFARALAHRGVWLAYQDRQRDRQAEEQRSRLIQP